MRVKYPPLLSGRQTSTSETPRIRAKNTVHAQAAKASLSLLRQKRPPTQSTSILTAFLTYHDAVSQGLSAETSEHHAVRGAQARAGKHGDGCLGHHGHVERHEVSLLHAQLLHGVGHSADLPQQLLVGDLGDHSGLVAFVQDGNLSCPKQESRRIVVSDENMTGGSQAVLVLRGASRSAGSYIRGEKSGAGSIRSAIIQQYSKSVVIRAAVGAVPSLLQERSDDLVCYQASPIRRG